MVSDNAICISNVSKCYRLGNARPTLRNALDKLTSRLAGRQKKQAEQFWALRDVSFRVRKGEVLGIIGPNGAGKTTMLKLLSGVTFPTTGEIHIEGRIGALIELGAGFHPDLSGQENIFLNAALLGLSRKEIARKFESIVAFSELEQFIDTPVKHYSSGMYARLGFSTAVHIEPDVLLVDEVLSVGDLNFQSKSINRMRELSNADRAIVFVSHNLISLRGFCNRVIWLDHGQVMQDGDPNCVISAYQDATFQHRVQPENRSEVSRDVTILRVELLKADGTPGEIFTIGESLRLHIHYRAIRPNNGLVLAVSFWRLDGLKCGETSNLLEDVHVDVDIGDGMVEFELEALKLMPNSYYINVALSNNYLAQYDAIRPAVSFSILPENPLQAPCGPFYFKGKWRRS